MSAPFVAAPSCGFVGALVRFVYPLGVVGRSTGVLWLAAVFISLGGVPAGVARMPRSVVVPVVAIGRCPIYLASTLVAARMLGEVMAGFWAGPQPLVLEIYFPLS